MEHLLAEPAMARGTHISGASFLEEPNYVAPSVWQTVTPNDVVPMCGEPDPHYRIGSPSLEGEVYRVTYKGIPSALKLMPVTSDEEEVKNLDEINVAVQASDLVVEVKSRYFPIVYAYGKCNNTTFYPDSPFQQKSQDYSCYKMLQTSYPEYAKRIQQLRKAKQPNENIINRLNLDTCPRDVPVRSYFMISELADEDLIQWNKRPHTYEEWLDVIDQVFSGVHDLHRLLNVSHNDLHLGNVLMLNGDALIHDFGRSEELYNEGKEWKVDYEKFLYSLELVVKNKEVLEEVDELNELLGKIEDESRYVREARKILV